MEGCKQAKLTFLTLTNEKHVKERQIICPVLKKRPKVMLSRLLVDILHSTALLCAHSCRDLRCESTGDSKLLYKKFSHKKP